VKFSTFVKLGGHAFSLLQNKDLYEIYGMAKPTIPKLLQVGKQSVAAQSSPPPVKQWPVASFPTHFPVPIDSPLMHGHFGPYGMPHRPGWIYGPAVPPTSPYSMRTASHRKNTRRS
jgi:hypothetical protein